MAPAHLLQEGAGPRRQRVVRQEQQQRGAFAQLALQEAGLCPRRLQPLEDGLVVFEHPATDGVRREVTFLARENLRRDDLGLVGAVGEHVRVSTWPISYQRGVEPSVEVNALIVRERYRLRHLFAGHDPEAHDTVEICTGKTRH